MRDLPIDHMARPSEPVQDFVLRKPALHFEVYQDGASQWWWRLAMADGTVMGEAPSPFDSRKACLESVERMRQTVSAPIHEC